MKSKVRKIGFLIALLVLVAATLTACQLNATIDEKLDKYGLSAQITYHANGGRINGNETLYFADVYYKEGSKALNLGIDEKNGSLSVVRENYSFIGWYYPAKNADGSIQYTNEEKDEVVLSDEEFDFSSYRAKTGDEIHLYALWMAEQQVNYLLAPEDKIDNKLVIGDKTYLANVNDADNRLREEKFDSQISISKPKDPFNGKATNYTFVEYYTDAECTNPVKWPVKRTGESTDIIIYAKYLPSEWKAVRTASEFSKIFSAMNNTGKYYILNDIDGKGMTIDVKANATFSGVIEGNGYTISNVTFNNAKLQNSNVASIFGRIISGAKIANITLKDCKTNFKANTNSNIYAYYFAESIADDATIANVKIDGGELFVNTLSEGSSWLNSAESTPLCNGGEDRLTIVKAPALTDKNEY